MAKSEFFWLQCLLRSISSQSIGKPKSCDGFDGIEYVWTRRQEAVNFANKCRTEQRVDVDQFQHLGKFSNLIHIRALDAPSALKRQTEILYRNSKTVWAPIFTRYSGLVSVTVGSVQRPQHIRGPVLGRVFVCASNWSQWKCHVPEDSSANILLCLCRRCAGRVSVCAFSISFTLPASCTVFYSKVSFAMSLYTTAYGIEHQQHVLN